MLMICNKIEQFNNSILDTDMKKNILNSYSTPTFNIYEVEVDKGFAGSIEIPGMGSEDDEIGYYGIQF